MISKGVTYVLDRPNLVFCVSSGEDNVMGVELCLRNRDHVVIVMQYFPHEKFMVSQHLQSDFNYSVLEDFENASLVLLLLTLGIHDVSAKLFST